MADYTPEEEKAIAEFVNKVNAQLQTINLRQHGELLKPEEILANAVFWLKILHEHYPELEELAAVLINMMVIRATPVHSDEEAAKMKKGLLN